jgi:hypothetical protein
MTAASLRALELGRAQLLLLRAGDFEGYEAGRDAYERACEALSGLDPASFGPDDQANLRELLVVERDAALELARLRGETSARMVALRKSSRAAGAYLASPPPIAGRVNRA